MSSPEQQAASSQERRPRSPFLTVPEVARILRCHEKTVRRLIGRREIRATLIAGRYLIRIDDVPGALPARKPPPPPPVAPAGIASQAVRTLERRLA